MALSFVAVSYAGATLTATEPTGTASGDIMVAVVMAGSHTAHTGPAGWTALDQVDGSNTERASTWRIVRGGSAPSLTWGGPSAADTSIEIATYRGGDTTTPIDAHNLVEVTGDSTPDSPSLTATVANTILLCALVHAFEDPVTITTPSGMTSRWNKPSGDWFAGADLAVAATGATGGKTWTEAGFAHNSLMISVLIRPAGGGGGTTTPISASATQTQSVSMRKTVNLARPATQTQAATMSKQANLSRATTQSQTATARKTVNLVRSTTQTQTATHGKTVSLARAASQTQAATGAALKVVVRVLSVTQTQVATFSKQVALRRTVTQPQALSVRQAVSLARTLQQAQTATRQLTALVQRAASQVQSAVSSLVVVPGTIPLPPSVGLAVFTQIPPGGRSVAQSDIVTTAVRVVDSTPSAAPTVGSARPGG